MKVTIELEQDDYNHLHDVVMEALGFEPTNEQIKKYFDKLPDDIKGTAVSWGTSDSVFREKFYEWLEENQKK